jgi:hypothetical protein
MHCIQCRQVFKKTLARPFVDAQVELFKVLARNPTDKVARHFLVQAAQCLKDGLPENMDRRHCNDNKMTEDSTMLERRRNILHPQCFDWNAKPLRVVVQFETTGPPFSRRQRWYQSRELSQSSRLTLRKRGSALRVLDRLPVLSATLAPSCFQIQRKIFLIRVVL